MLRTRIIPSLLIHKGGLVKTIRFADPRYVGDPLNAVRIFNEKNVDELAVFDIDATSTKTPPNLTLIQRLASECRMPLCYGGGVSQLGQVEEIIALGVEKVAIASALVSHPDLLSRAAARVGRQSLVAVLDVRRIGSSYEVYLANGARATGLDATDAARKYADEGAGEIVVNAIDRDGTMEGYDLDLGARMRRAVNVPLTMLGGAGSLDDIARLVGHVGLVGAAAGSLFVYKGSRRAVLLNYPRPEQRAELLASTVARPSI
jgi:cyclase